MNPDYLAGQRVADTLGRARQCHPHKSGQDWAKLRIELVGDLKTLIDRIMPRKAGYKIRSTQLIVIESPQPMTYHMLRGRLDAARLAAGVDKAVFQMRDLRAKVGTDKAESSGDTPKAQQQLDHTTVAMAKHYTRQRRWRQSDADEIMELRKRLSELRKSQGWRETVSLCF